MSIKGLMVAGAVVAVVALAGCQNHDSYQQQPQYSASQSGYSSKLGKTAAARSRTQHATNRNTTATTASRNTRNQPNQG